MSRFQLKATHHTKNQKDLKLNEKDNNAQTTEILELLGKDF